MFALKNYFPYFLISLIAASLGGLLVFAQTGGWTGPASAPPGGNAPAPLREPLSQLIVLDGFKVKNASQLIDYTYTNSNYATRDNYDDPRCPCDNDGNGNQCGASFKSIVDLGSSCFDWAGNPTTREYKRNSGNYSASSELFGVEGGALRLGLPRIVADNLEISGTVIVGNQVRARELVLPGEILSFGQRRLSSVRFGVGYINGPEDGYLNLPGCYQTPVPTADTCNGDVNNGYACLPNEFKLCQDYWKSSCKLNSFVTGWSTRYVTCVPQPVIAAF